MKGKIRLDKHLDKKTGNNWLSTLKHYLDEGWKLKGITKKDTAGFYWFILEK